MMNYSSTPESQTKVHNMTLSRDLCTLRNVIELSIINADDSMISSEKLGFTDIYQEIATAKQSFVQASTLVEQSDIRLIFPEVESVNIATGISFISAEMNYPLIVQLGSDLCGLRRRAYKAPEITNSVIILSNLLQYHSISLSLVEMTKHFSKVQEILNNPRIQEFTSTDEVVPF